MSIYLPLPPSERDTDIESLTVWFHEVMWKLVDNDKVVEDVVNAFKESIKNNIDDEELQSLYLDHIVF